MSPELDGLGLVLLWDGEIEYSFGIDKICGYNKLERYIWIIV